MANLPNIRTTLLSSGVSLALALALLGAPASAGIWGTPDAVPAATLIVPFFEVGIDQATNVQNTNIQVYARSSTTIHWEVWNIDGEASDNLFGNVELPGAETWSLSLASLLSSASASDRARLDEGDFYRGFMTIDVVTESTSATPFDVDYPFGTSNDILGTIYYLRLLEGSANGLPMIAIEHTADAGVSPFLEGFYSADDHREEIDDRARTCAATLTHAAGACAATDDNISNIRARIFRSAALSGTTRVIIFTWNTDRPNEGGPSAICADIGGCNTSYSFSQYREDGTRVNPPGETLMLPHVVNIIPTVGDNPGEMQIQNIPDPTGSMQIYAFSLNSASPAGNPNINWDAILEANIDVD
ncbi:MAG: hypothetical protein K8J08_04135 [Thermoanaerobaculia bacterium]|nr:hypothetical protein [Thermoanaerobaculia bacterium]